VIKGKSRLKQQPVELTNKIAVEPFKDFTQAKKKETSGRLVKYLQHLPTLILGIFFYIILFFIFNNFDPDLLKNIILPNSYLAVLLIFFIANFFLFSFIFLNSIRGFIYSLFILLIIFFKIQNVVFDGILLSILILSILLFESLMKIGSVLAIKK